MLAYFITKIVHCVVTAHAHLFPVKVNRILMVLKFGKNGRNKCKCYCEQSKQISSQYLPNEVRGILRSKVEVKCTFFSVDRVFALFLSNEILAFF